MSSTVFPTLEPVCAEMIGWLVSADDSAPIIDSLDLNDAAVVHVENNGSDGRATHQNSLVRQVKSDAGPLVVAGLEETCSFDMGDSAVGPSNQAASGARTTIANYGTEIVNSDRLDEYGASIGGRDLCRRGKEVERA